ncbi:MULTISPECIES: SCO family protein [unclassified Roseovarius]|jgi:protein SCO1/2|uniref:SCO family protein n=1 Tax=unclassified Roseovarius TaxID=2614913 RepID=UPI0000687CF2|nr:MULTISPECIES: SCO family protein [unclassified Roseovarius]EAQ24606.1 regulatory protein SenC [Roseovarius sp. 217]KJS45521.1 MAG: protein senC [Roseovarius sp. BRH_c41]
MTRLIAMSAAAVLIFGLGITYVMTMGKTGDDQFAQCRASNVAGGAAQIGGAFTLVSETGETVTDKEVIDQPALIYFGYTFCPDVCPLDGARNAAAVDLLEERGAMVKPVFISIDPKRDTPEVMAEYTEYLHPRMLGLTGSEEQVRAASKAYRTFFQAHKPTEGEEEFYLVDHSTMTYLSLPQHGFVEFFRRDVTPEQMADRVQCFIDAS